MKREAQLGDTVRFLVNDIFLPGPGGVFVAPLGETQLEGTVMGFSDSGATPRAFAVVEVIRREMVVVPIEKLALGPAGPAKFTN